MQLFGGGGTGTPTGWPLPWWAAQAFGPVSTVKLAGVANQLSLFGFVLPCSISVSKILYNVTVIDAGGLYDLGVYSYAGVLLGNIGAQAIPATGVITKSFLQGSILMTPGKYYFGTTGNSITATISTSNPGPGAWTFLAQGSIVATSGGLLPASCTPPADSNTDLQTPIFALSA